MRFISFTNEAHESAGVRVLFNGSELVRRVLAAGAASIAPFPGHFLIAATTSLGGTPLEAPAMALQGDAATVTASLIDGAVLLLDIEEATAPHTIVCNNPLPAPVTFTVSIDQLPVQFGATVPSNAQRTLSTIPEFTFEATVGNVPLPAVTVTLANANVRITETRLTVTASS